MTFDIVKYVTWSHTRLQQRLFGFQARLGCFRGLGPRARRCRSHCLKALTLMLLCLRHSGGQDSLYSSPKEPKRAAELINKVKTGFRKCYSSVSD